MFFLSPQQVYYTVQKWLAAIVRAWRCGDIPCYVSPGLKLSKDMKMKIYFIAGLYSSVGYAAE